MTPAEVAFRVPGMAKARKAAAGERTAHADVFGQAIAWKRRRPRPAFIWWRRRSAILRDISLRALEIAGRRRRHRLRGHAASPASSPQHYGIATPLTPYHEHNAAEARPKILARLGKGAAVALVSDAGTPLISDPGYRLVREAVEAGSRGDRRCRALPPCWPRSPSPACRPTVFSSRGFCRPNKRRGKSASPNSRHPGDAGAV